ncbi:MAG TPA: hypothetical protein VIY90_09350 [Steroidobacteraceae bacterium]
MRIVDVIAFAERIQIVALAWVLLPRQAQGVENLALIAQDNDPLAVEQRKLAVEESHIERCIVND